MTNLGSSIRLTDILQPDCVKVPLGAQTKQQAIEELVALLCHQTHIQDQGNLLEVVWARETTRTTGIGHGVAIPHGKCHGCSRLVMAIGKPSEPIDFGSIDGKPVDLVILLASPPDQTGPHIQALAHISRMLTIDRFRAGMKQASTAQQVYDLIVEYESKAAH